MSIQDLSKLSARQIETLKKKQSREISRLEDTHQNMKADLKKSQEMEMVDINNHNIRQVSDASDKKEKVLSQMRHHLDETRKLTDKQIKDLKDNVEKTTTTEHQRLSVERDRLKSENDLYLEDMNHRFTHEQQKVTTDNQNQLAQLKQIRQGEVADNEKFYQDKISTQTNNFTEKFQADTRTYQKMKDDQDKQFKTERMTTNKRQQQDMVKLTDSHNKHIEVRDKEYRKGLKEQDVFFEKKFADNLKIRNDELTRLDDLNKKVMTKMKSDLQEKLTANINRSDDPFYRFTELDPKIKQLEDRVEISVEIPEHSKADVVLTTNGKEAIINFNRRYDDARQENGVTNKLHKVESFTTRLPTHQVLDAKSVKSNYENGVMTYIIKHA